MNFGTFIPVLASFLYLMIFCAAFNFLCDRERQDRELIAGLIHNQKAMADIIQTERLNRK